MTRERDTCYGLENKHGKMLDWNKNIEKRKGRRCDQILGDEKYGVESKDVMA